MKAILSGSADASCQAPTRAGHAVSERLQMTAPGPCWHKVQAFSQIAFDDKWPTGPDRPQRRKAEHRQETLHSTSQATLLKTHKYQSKSLYIFASLRWQHGREELGPSPGQPLGQILAEFQSGITLRQFQCAAGSIAAVRAPGPDHHVWTSGSVLPDQ